MKTLATILCVLTLLAVAYLSVSVVLLRPPRANYAAWFTFAALVCMQTAATLLAIRMQIAWLRVGVSAGAAALFAAGVWLVRGTLTGAHFEGYALILGAMLAAQGIVTIGALARRFVVRETV